MNKYKPDKAEIKGYIVMFLITLIVFVTMLVACNLVINNKSFKTDTVVNDADTLEIVGEKYDT